MSLQNIEKLTKEYAVSRDFLSCRVRELEEELQQVKKRHLRGIKNSVNTAKTWESRLRNAIEASPDLFVKPRTIVLYGIKIGMEKGKGKLVIENEDMVIKRIKRFLPDMVDILIKTEETPIKTALAKLEAKDLKVLGIQIKDTEDQVVLKPTDSEVDKLVDALLKEKEEEAKEAA